MPDHFSQHMGQRTPLYPIIHAHLREVDHVISEKLTAWRMFSAQWKLDVTNFYGKRIHYSGIRYEGSPEQVFWGGFIEPFLHDGIEGTLKMVLDECSKRSLDSGKYLDEACSLLKQLVQKTYTTMVETDRVLRGSGFPQSVEPRDASDAIEKMTQYIISYREALTHRAEDNNTTSEGWWQRIKSSINLRPGIFGFSIDLKRLFSKKKNVLSNTVAEIASPPVSPTQPPITTFVQDGFKIEAHHATLTNATQTTVIKPGYVEIKSLPSRPEPAIPPAKPDVPPASATSDASPIRQKLRQFNIAAAQSRMDRSMGMMRERLRIGQEQSEKEKRLRLWALREEGVQLRNEVPTDHAEWYSRFDNWHKRLLEAAEALNPELKAWLHPLNTVKEWNVGLWVNDAHRRQLNWISELLDRLENYLRPS